MQRIEEDKDILAEIRLGCQTLEQGELVLDPTLTLWDVLSATQIDEPRMDSGTSPAKILQVIDPRVKHTQSVEETPRQGIDALKLLSPDQVLWIMDRLLVCEMSFHTGEALYTSVFICHYIFRLGQISFSNLQRRYPDLPSTDPRISLLGGVLRSFLAAFVKCIHLAYSDMCRGRLYDIEDWHALDSGVSFDSLDPMLPTRISINETDSQVRNKVISYLIQNLNDSLQWMDSSLLSPSDENECFIFDQIKVRLTLRKHMLSLMAFNSEPLDFLPTVYDHHLQQFQSAISQIPYYSKYTGALPCNFVTFDIDPPPGLEDVFDPLLTRTLPTQSSPRSCQVLTRTIKDGYQRLERLLQGFHNLQSLWLSANLRHIYIGRLGDCGQDNRDREKENGTEVPCQISYVSEGDFRGRSSNIREVGWAEWFSYFHLFSWREQSELPYVRATQMTFLDNENTILGTLSAVDLFDSLLFDYTGLEYLALLNQSRLGCFSENVNTIVNDISNLAIVYLNNMCHNRPRQRRLFVNDIPGIAKVVELSKKLPQLVKNDVLRLCSGVDPRTIPSLDSNSIPTALSLIYMDILVEITLSGFELELYSTKELQSTFWVAQYLISLRVQLLEQLGSNKSGSPFFNFLRYQTQFSNLLRTASNAGFLVTFLLQKYDVQPSDYTKKIFYRRFKWATPECDTLNCFTFYTAWEDYQQARKEHKSRTRESIIQEAKADLDRSIEICDILLSLTSQESCTQIANPSDQSLLLHRLKNSCLVNLTRLRALPDDPNYEPTPYDGISHPWLPIMS